MKALRYSLVLVMVALFAGCSVLPRPAPSPQPVPPSTAQPVPAPSPAPESQPAPSAKPSRNTAVLALLEQAKSRSASGELAAAGASLERALRIEPRNPFLWQELARVRLSQGQYRQAENMAAKSNALAGGDNKLRAENWRIIGQARSKLGNQKGAEAAFQKAEQE